MTNAHPRPWHRHSTFGDGHRVPMCRERRAVWKARIEMLRRAKRITDGCAHVAEALIHRLGRDGRCDPSHATLARDSAESESTVKRALVALREIGMVAWARRLVREGWRTAQTSNAYLLILGAAPAVHCDGQNGRETKTLLKQGLSYLPAPSERDRQSALVALAARRAVVEGRLMKGGCHAR